MASLTVHGPASVIGQHATGRIAAHLREAGHDVQVTAGIDLAAIRDTDATVAILDGDTGPVLGSVTAAAALDHPVLALVGPGVGPAIDHARIHYHTGVDIDDWLTGLADWSEEIRPFSGRLVRDLIPRLVKEAGHAVTFRAVDAADRPRFLKQKVLQEANELVAAGAGAEKEEIGDLLEVMEALIRERGYDREALKQVKDAKRKQRGAFERCWVVETTQAPPEEEEPSAGDLLEA